MKDEQKYQSPEPGKGDAAHAVARAVLSTIRMLGGAAIELFSAIITPPLERCRQEWMEEVGAALRKLEEEPLWKCGPTPANQDIQPTFQQPRAAVACALVGPSVILP